MPSPFACLPHRAACRAAEILQQNNARGIVSPLAMPWSCVDVMQMLIHLAHCCMLCFLEHQSTAPVTCVKVPHRFLDNPLVLLHKHDAFQSARMDGIPPSSHSAQVCQIVERPRSAFPGFTNFDAADLHRLDTGHDTMPDRAQKHNSCAACSIKTPQYRDVA